MHAARKTADAALRPLSRALARRAAIDGAYDRIAARATDTAAAVNDVDGQPAEKPFPAKLTSETREQVIREHLHLVKRIAHGILCRLPSEVDANDLMSAGIMGLLNAVDRFEPSRGKSFEMYAKFRIRGAILDELRQLDYLSRGNRRRARELEKTVNGLQHQLGRRAGDDEVAKAMGVELDELHAQIETTRTRVFLDAQDLGIEQSSRLDELRHILGQARDGEAYDHVLLREMRERLVSAIDSMPQSLKTVIGLYYYSELNFKEIGKVLELTESRICQLHGQALKQLRASLQAER